MTTRVWMLVINGYKKDETIITPPRVFLIPSILLTKELKDALLKYNGGKWHSDLLNYNKPLNLDDEMDLDRRNSLCMFFHKYKVNKNGENVNINVIIEKSLFYIF